MHRAHFDTVSEVLLLHVLSLLLLLLMLLRRLLEVLIQHAAKELIQESPVVATGCLLLDFRSDCVKAALKQLFELELFLHDVLCLHQALFEVPLDDAPQCFDRVEFRGVCR